MTDGDAVVVRPTAVEDRPAVLEVVRAAFSPSGEEAALVEWVWGSTAWLPGLDLVAVEGGAVVGHVLHSRARVGSCDVAALAPLAVAPDRQRRGIGGRLVTAALGRAEAGGEALVVLLGHPGYYPRFGFVPGRQAGLDPPGPLRDESAFQVRPLAAFVPGACRGRLEWAWGDRW